MWSRHARAAATTQTVATARASERRNGFCRVPAPHLTRSEDGMGRGRSTRRSSGEVPEALLPHEPGTQHFTLDDDDSVPELGDLTASTRSGRRSGFCGTPWSRLETLLLGCLLSMLLCRRWLTASRLQLRGGLLPCPRSSRTPTPQRLEPSEPQQLVEQLVEVPLPNPVLLAHGRAATFHRDGGNLLVDARHQLRQVERPAGVHRQPRAVYKYWAVERRLKFL